MNDKRTLIADYLDGLVDTEDMEEARALVEAEPELVAEVERMRAILYRPFVVADPQGLADRVWARFHERPRLRLLRYAAVFAAGVLTTLLIQSGAPRPSTPDSPEPTEQPVAVHNRILR